VAIRADLAAAVGDHHRRRREQLLEVLGEVVERLDHELVEFARRVVGRRQRREHLAAIDELPELRLGHLLLADCGDRDPRRGERDRDRPGDQRQQVLEPSERGRVQEQEEDADQERGQRRRPQRRPQRLTQPARLLVHPIQVRQAPPPPFAVGLRR
jgi:hypothetical protein